jgi:hypothetical protein
MTPTAFADILTRMNRQDAKKPREPGGCSRACCEVWREAGEGSEVARVVEMTLALESRMGRYAVAGDLQAVQQLHHETLAETARVRAEMAAEGVAA